MIIWNPWEKKKNLLCKTSDFDLPVRKDTSGVHQIEHGTVIVSTCSTGDFFLPEADLWRGQAWKMISERQDLNFLILTQKIERFPAVLPNDWGEGYPNVAIGCICRNQEEIDRQIPISLKYPIHHRKILVLPILSETHIAPYLVEGKVNEVICGGDQGKNGRICDYRWICHLRKQCIDSRVAFYFYRTGTNFLKDGKIYHISKLELQQEQAMKAGINFIPNPAVVKKLETEDFQDFMNQLFNRLEKSKFRSKFHLGYQDMGYIRQKGMDVIEKHAADFVRQRLAPAEPINDGKQTPMRGHPVFLAQHGTGTCCRGCLSKWHHIPKGRKLTADEQTYVVSVIMEWIRRELHSSPYKECNKNDGEDA